MLPIIKYVLRQYKHCAERRGISWQLTDDEAVKMMSCACVYCGAENTNTARRSQYAVKEFTYNGIDRINSDQPYTLSNTVSCCKQCNAAKTDMTLADFLNSAYIANRRNVLRSL